MNDTAPTLPTATGPTGKGLAGDDLASDGPVAYAPGGRRGDSVFGLVGLAVGLLCATLPLSMAWGVVRGTQRRFNVYTPYAGDIGVFHLGTNWPWFAFDTLAILLGVVAVYRGRLRFGLVAAGLGVLNMIAVMTFVLGSPWGTP